MVNTAAAANTGRQREPSQSSRGNRKTAGAISDQEPVSRANANPFATDTTTTANVPSRTSRADGASRTAAAIPIEQRRNRYDAERGGREPDLPDVEKRRRRGA